MTRHCIADCWGVFSDKHWLFSLERAKRKVTNLRQVNMKLSEHIQHVDTQHTHTHTGMLVPATGLNASHREGEGLTTNGRPGKERRGECRSHIQLVPIAVQHFPLAVDFLLFYAALNRFSIQDIVQVMILGCGLPEVLICRGQGLINS